MQAGSSPTVQGRRSPRYYDADNANLGDTTLSSAKIQLINAAQSRQVGVTRNYTLEDQDCDNLKSIKDLNRGMSSDLPGRTQ